MPFRSTAAALALSAALLAATAAHAQSSAHQHALPPGDTPPTATPMDHAAHHTAMGAAQPSGTAGAVPTMPGQDAFGTIQEIIRILDADPATDWGKVDIEALRQHLIDMNEVTLNAKAAATPVDGGARFAVTGDGRTLDAIRRMVPAHAREMNGVDGWAMSTAPLPDGVLLTVTAADPHQTARIRGLGFIGIMAQGSHHQMHHLAMARGGFAH